MTRVKKKHHLTWEEEWQAEQDKLEAEWAASDAAEAAAAEARKPETFEDWCAKQQKKEADLKEQRRLEKATKPKPLGAGNTTKPAAKKKKPAV